MLLAAFAKIQIFKQSIEAHALVETHSACDVGADKTATPQAVPLLHFDLRRGWIFGDERDRDVSVNLTSLCAIGNCFTGKGNHIRMIRHELDCVFKIVRIKLKIVVEKSDDVTVIAKCVEDAISLKC